MATKASIELMSGAFWHYDMGRAEQGPISFIDDIATPLSRICRFLGHTLVPWSVASHAVACSAFARRTSRGSKLQWLALHHDDHEALIGDIVAPLKFYLQSCSIGALSDRAQCAIVEAIGGRLAFPSEDRIVKTIDIAILEGERRALKPMSKPWGLPVSEEDAKMATEIVTNLARGGLGFDRPARDLYLETHDVLLDQIAESGERWP